MSQRHPKGLESGSPSDCSCPARCSGGVRGGEWTWAWSLTLEEQFANPSFRLSPPGILVMNGLEGVSQTPRGSQVPYRLTGKQTYASACPSSDEGRCLPACSVNWQMTLESGNCEGNSPLSVPPLPWSNPCWGSLFLVLRRECCLLPSPDPHSFPAAHSQWQ